MEEKYNGWTNRETWALNLWLTNDEGLYNMTLEMLKEAHTRDIDNGTEIIEKIDALRDFVEELEEQVKTQCANEELISMMSDIGSLWRVNWAEVVEAFKEDLN